MPITTKTVLTCGACSADKAEANGWFIVFSSPQAVTVRRALESEDPSNCKGADAACGQQCALKMVSRGMVELKHGAAKEEWKRKR